MSQSDQDLVMETIAAVATAPGKGGVGIVRVSGPATIHIAEKILGKLPAPRFAEYLPFYDDRGTYLVKYVNTFNTSWKAIKAVQGHMVK